MREILFRGKTEKGDWVFGMAWIFKEKTMICPWKKGMCKYDTGYYPVQVVPKTFGQYTGLTDKNGKKIFEGDIVKADDYIFSIKYGKCGGTPNADNYGYMGFYLEAVSEGTKACAKYGLRDDMCYFTDIAVIGNIYDNPEFLN